MLNSPLSGTSLKQKRDSIQVMVGTKKISAKPSILMKKRMFFFSFYIFITLNVFLRSTLPQYMRNSLLSKQSQVRIGDFSSRCLALYHHFYDHLRFIPSFRISTPKLSLLDGLNPFVDNKETPKLDISELITLINSDYFPSHIDKIKIFVVDENTAIPYTLLESEVDSNNIGKNKFNKSIKKIKIILII